MDSRCLVLVLGLWGLTCCTQHFQILPSADYNCSVPGVRCSVVNSNCIDSSWIHPRQWTPSAPSKLDVKFGVIANEEGDRVPVLEISWTVAVDGKNKSYCKQMGMFK
ncbi:hypothetical protein GDO86_005117 [Hymenochirus boettgeri]|uniref:IL17RA/B N-terminal domain-containing protein n=1 Tax=Hymenochirus boettgeri TaxID=247094 RepID=A0A8T2J850_9PIPI|nr:hypothetical protein GDO86_005117 [Hymenochirus boettgeri]